MALKGSTASVGIQHPTLGKYHTSTVDWSERVRPAVVDRTADTQAEEGQLALQKIWRVPWEHRKGRGNEFTDFSKFSIPGPTPHSDFLLLMPGTVYYFVTSYLPKPPFPSPSGLYSWRYHLHLEVPDPHL